MSLVYIVRFSLEGMLTEFNSLKTNVQRLKSQLQNVDQEVKDQFSSFLEVYFSLNLFYAVSIIVLVTSWCIANIK